MKKKYIIAKGWGHIFAGNTVSDTRWALDVRGRKLVAGFILERRWWQPLMGYSLLDLQEDVEHNVLLALDDGTYKKFYEEYGDSNLLRTNELPEWALNPQEAHAD